MKKTVIFWGVAVLILCVSTMAVAEGIQWQAYKSGMALGKAEKKKIFINFYADW